MSVLAPRKRAREKRRQEHADAQREALRERLRAKYEAYYKDGLRDGIAMAFDHLENVDHAEGVGYTGPIPDELRAWIKNCRQAHILERLENGT